jgi:hypothetical protein
MSPVHTGEEQRPPYDRASARHQCCVFEIAPASHQHATHLTTIRFITITRACGVTFEEATGSEKHFNIG